MQCPLPPGDQFRISGWRRCSLLLACVAVLLAPQTGHAALTAGDLDTQALERKVADDPRGAVRESELWQEQATKSGDKALRLRALRLLAMASAQMEEAVKLTKAAAEGLALARELHDPLAECEFLSAKANALSSDGKFLEAQPVFDEAIIVAEKAGLTRAATNVMVTKAYTYGLLGRDTDSLDLLFKAHQRFIELGDEPSARATLSSIGNAYTHDRASREELLKALSYHQQAIQPDAEKTAATSSPPSTSTWAWCTSG